MSIASPIFQRDLDLYHMEIIQAIILGIIQGVTEFLPVSSSAHLVLFPWFFSWEDPGLTFDIALHFGTLIAVISYFWRDWIIIISNLKSKISKPDNKNQAREQLIDYPSQILWFIAIATIPGVLAGYFLNAQAETIFRHPLLIASTLFVFGLLLYLVDKYFEQKKDIGEITLRDSLLIGLVQALAIVPGVSRSGVTITAARALKISRTSAARFSFLLSTPIIIGATLYKAGDFFSSPITAAEIFGILAAAISGYLAIAWLIKFVEKASYAIFFWYRFALAIFIVVLYFLN